MREKQVGFLTVQALARFCLQGFNTAHNAIINEIPEGSDFWSVRHVILYPFASLARQAGSHAHPSPIRRNIFQTCPPVPGFEAPHQQPKMICRSPKRVSSQFFVTRDLFSSCANGYG